METTVREPWRRDPRYGVYVAALGLAVTAFVVLALLGIVAPGFIKLDASVSAWVRSLANPTLDRIAIGFTVFGDVTVMTILTVVTALALWLKRRHAEALLLAATVALGTGIGQVLKLVVRRSRPAIEYARVAVPDSYGFPSGHALASLVFFGVIVFLLMTTESKLSLRARTTLALVCALVVMSVSMSRVYLGVHYMSDVIGGWLVGFVVLNSALLTFIRRWQGSTAAAGVPPVRGNEYHSL